MLVPGHLKAIHGQGAAQAPALLMPVVFVPGRTTVETGGALLGVASFPAIDQFPTGGHDDVLGLSVGPRRMELVEEVADTLEPTGAPERARMRHLGMFGDDALDGSAGLCTLRHGIFGKSHYLANGLAAERLRRNGAELSRCFEVSDNVSGVRCGAELGLVDPRHRQPAPAYRNREGTLPPSGPANPRRGHQLARRRRQARAGAGGRSVRMTETERLAECVATTAALTAKSLLAARA